MKFPVPAYCPASARGETMAMQKIAMNAKMILRIVISQVRATAVRHDPQYL
jgi:hypothetical protein